MVGFWEAAMCCGDRSGPTEIVNVDQSPRIEGQKLYGLSNVELDGVSPTSAGRMASSSARRVFGVCPQELSLRHGWLVPPFVRGCCEWIEAYALGVEGCWRVAGDETQISFIQAELNRGVNWMTLLPDPQFPEEGVGIVTGLLLRFLKLLPAGLFHEEHQLDNLMAAGNDTGLIQEVIDSMEHAHQATLARLVYNWRLVAREENDNKMHAANIATCVFSTLTGAGTLPDLTPQHLICLLQPVLCIIESADVIFREASEQCQLISSDLKRSMTVTQNEHLKEDLHRVESEQGLEAGSLSPIWDSLVTSVDILRSSFEDLIGVSPTSQG